MKERYIAVFDSGLGGISVLRSLLSALPLERYLYYGDSANAPYGGRPTQEARALTLAAAAELAQRGIKALVVACNTATAAAINDLRAIYPDLIVVGMEPALKPAVDRFPGGRIGVMATELTLREEKFAGLLDRVGIGCQVYPISVPGLVELVEAGLGESAEAEDLLRPILEPYAGVLDALVLGCTHFPFAAGVIGRLLPGTALFDGGAGTAHQTRRRLEAAGLLWDGPGQVIFENSDPSPERLALCARLLGTAGE